MQKLCALAILLMLSESACTENKFAGGAAAGPTTSATSNEGTPGSQDGSKDPANPSSSTGNSTSPNGQEEPDLNGDGKPDSSNNGNGTGNNGTGQPGSSNGGDPNQCVDGDTIKFTFEGPIKACYDQGRVWNFDRNECVQMRQSSFACEWSNVLGALDKLGLSNSTVTAASNDPESKLVGCGESADKNRIVVQWVKIPEGKVVNCKNPELTGAVITGCFTFYPDNNIPPPPANQAERDKQVYDCMSQL